MDNVKVFRFAQRAVNSLPESVGRGIFNCIGTVSALLPNKGVRQLRKNQARIVPNMSVYEARKLCMRAMRSYMRYYYEVIRLPSMPHEQIRARVAIAHEDKALLHTQFRAGKSATAALLHSGNWDLAGAWAELELTHVETLAERLDPPELYDFFVGVRSAIGLTIYPAGKGALHSLLAAMNTSVCFTPVLADRDLTASGVEVEFFGEKMLVAPGPALLAQRTGCPIFPIFSHYRKLCSSERRRRKYSWEMVITVGKPVYATTTQHSSAQERRVDIERMSQEWISQFEPLLREHPEDWHMLQKVFVNDLDPERLARTRERARVAVGDTLEEGHAHVPLAPEGSDVNETTEKPWENT